MTTTHQATQGNYAGLANGSNIGRTDEGWFIEIQHKGEYLKFEEFGENVVDLIQMGADVYIEAVLKEWNAAAIQNIIWNFAPQLGRIDCPAGRFASRGSAFPLILTANPCTPAATDTAGNGATLTFHSVVMEPDFAIRINLNNDTRMVPVRFRALFCNVGTDAAPVYEYFTAS